MDTDGKWEPTAADLAAWYAAGMRNSLSAAPEEAPLVQGGQGRDAAEIHETGAGCAWIAALVLVACVASIVWLLATGGAK